MKKLIFSRFSLLLMLVLVVHAIVTIKTLTANGKNASSDSLNYSPLEITLPGQASIEGSRIAALFNIKPYTKPDVAADTSTQAQKETSATLKVLAITRRNDAFQAVVAIVQDNKSTLQNVVVNDTVANFQVAEITKFQLSLVGENGESRRLELFKPSEHAKSSEQNKDN